MRITKIHLFNFRSVDDLILDCSVDGLHAITGRFGAGKSSFFTGVRFALFGDTGEAGNNLDLRRRGCDDAEEAGCEVTFTHGQDTYVARRWMRRHTTKRGPSEKVSASLSINGVDVDGMGARTLTKLMEDRLGLTARSFSGASLIPQGDVATLVKATPTEVQALIEEHTGIAPLTKARDIARQAAKKAESLMEVMPGSQEEVDLAEAEEAEAVEHSAAATAEHARAKEVHREASRKAGDTNERARELRNQERAAEQTRQQVAVAQARADDAHKAAEDLGDKVADRGITGDPNDAMVDLDARIGQLEDTTRRLGDAGVLAKNAADTARQAHDDLGRAVDAANRAHDDAETARNQRSSLEETIAGAGREEADAEGESRAAQAEQASQQAAEARLRKAVATLTGDGDESCCPTCRRSIEDAADLVSELTSDANAAAAAVAEAGARRAAADRRRQQAVARRREAEASLSGLEKIISHAAAVDTAADTARGRDASARGAAAKAHAELAALVGQEQSLTLDELTTIARDTYTANTAARDELLGTRSLLVRLAEARAAAVDADAAVDAATRRARDAHAPLAEDIAAAEAAAAAATVEEQNAARVMAEANAAMTSSNSVRYVVAERAEEARRRWEEKREANREAIIARGKAESIAALRSELLAEATRTICRGASELLSSFGGEYVAFHLGEDFVPHAELADGRLVRTSILSGGESALVGLAFRIGITLHVASGGMPEQVLCDEVTNYLDEAGRRAVLGALTSLFPSVLLISHTQEAQDYATVTHHMERMPLGSTTFAVSGDDAAPEGEVTPVAA